VENGDHTYIKGGAMIMMSLTPPDYIRQMSHNNSR